MGDPVAHLPGADNPDTLYIHRHVLIRSMRSPGSCFDCGLFAPVRRFYDEPRDRTTGVTRIL
jgi:hypothetical protein